MKSLKEVLGLSSEYLHDKKVDRPKRVAEELLAHLLGCKRIDLYMQFDRPMEDRELSFLRDWLKRCAQSEPVEYVIGVVDFFGSKIKVDARALIPRPETEILVDLVSKKISDRKSLWDICAGSGCIGVSLKRKFPSLQVSLSDVSEKALALAKENAVSNGVDVNIFLGDLLTPFQGKTTDLLICNPPYVSQQEFLDLDPSVRDFEPKESLVGGEDGLEYYRRLAADLPRVLEPGALVFLEIGSSLGKSIQEIFSSPIWEGQKLISDWSGKDRFFFLEKQ